MPETFTPKTWLDDPAGGTPMTAAELNRLENGVESMDDRITAAEGTVGSLGSRMTSAETSVSSLTGRVTTLESGGGGGGTISGNITTITKLTNAQYNALGTKDPNTLYLVTT